MASFLKKKMASKSAQAANAQREPRRGRLEQQRIREGGEKIELSSACDSHQSPWESLEWRFCQHNVTTRK